MTKNKMLILMTLAFSANLYGQSCQGIPEGTIERLDKPGKSLENAKIQDQDGLGTCYANSASLMLQSRLPGNPNVSYLNLAFMYAEKTEAPNVRKDGIDTGTRANKSLLIEGGMACDAIKIAKERGGVCARSDVALEEAFRSGPTQVGFNTPWIQEDLVKKLTQYYDDVFKDFGRKVQNSADPESKYKSLWRPKKKTTETPDEDTDKFKEYKLALKNIIEKSKNKFTKDHCLKPDTKNAETIVQNMMGRIYQFTNNPKNTKNKNFRSIGEVGKKLGLTIKIKRNGQYDFEASPYQATVFALRDVYIKEMLQNTVATPADAFLKAIQKIAPAFNEKMFKDIGGFGEEDLNLFAKDGDRYVEKNVGKCMEDSTLEYFKNDDGLVKDFANDTCLANYSNHAKNIKEIVTIMDKANMRNVNSLYSFLMDLPEMNYEQAMMKIIGPDCPDDKKIKFPENLTCESGSFNYSEPNKTAATDEKFLKETKEKLKDVAKDSLSRGNAFSISVCTGFFKTTAGDDFYNKTQECPKEKHGFHALTVVGYRCNAGQIQYLIQNSWGDWKEAETRFYETEPGKAWITEEDLAKNVYHYDVLKEENRK